MFGREDNTFTLKSSISDFSKDIRLWSDTDTNVMLLGAPTDSKKPIVSLLFQWMKSIVQIP